MQDRPLWYSFVRNGEAIISLTCNVFAPLLLQKFSYCLKNDVYFGFICGAHAAARISRISRVFPKSILDIPFSLINVGPVDLLLGVEDDVSLCLMTVNDDFVR